LIGKQGIQEELARRRERAEITDSMIVKDAKVGPPSSEATSNLMSTLARVDTDVLRYARENGVRFVVVKEGQDLADTGAIRRQDPGALKLQARDLGEKGRPILDAADEKNGARIRQLKEEISGYPPEASLFPLGLGSASPASRKLMELKGELARLEGERRAYADGELEKTSKGKVKIFNGADTLLPGEGGFGPLGAANAATMLASMPQTPESMAKMHGAATPEEIRQFAEAVEELNGERLPKLRARSLADFEKRIAAITDPEQKKQALSALDHLKRDPRSIPLDVKNEMVLVPNTYYYRPQSRPDAPPTVVDLHDYLTLKSWNGPDERIAGENPGGGGITLGQHMYRDGMNTIIIRESALTDHSAIHELGHAIEEINRRRDPDFGERFTKERDGVFSHVGSGVGKRRGITDYAETNAKENLAEGFAIYYTDPARLKAADPDLFALVEKEIAFSRGL
jgi:hypothetical protein